MDPLATLEIEASFRGHIPDRQYRTRRRTNQLVSNAGAEVSAELLPAWKTQYDEIRAFFCCIALNLQGRIADFYNHLRFAP